VCLVGKYMGRVLDNADSMWFTWSRMMSSELGENLFSRSEANKLALSKSDIASELSGLRNNPRFLLLSRVC
jgi:hypothetical protein